MRGSKPRKQPDKLRICCCCGHPVLLQVQVPLWAVLLLQVISMSPFLLLER